MPAATIAEYLAPLPEDRRSAVVAILDSVRAGLPAGYDEGIQYGMPSFFVPHGVYPPGYHCDPKQPLPFMGVASMKNYISVYLFCLYVDEGVTASFVTGLTEAGHKPDLGKACVRFKELDQIPFYLFGELVAAIPTEAFIASYEAQLRKPGV